MTPAPWFRTDWRVHYAKLLQQIRALEALARAAGRRLTP